MNDLQPIPLQLSRGQSILAESTNQSPQNVSGDISIAQVKSQLFHAGSTYHPGDNDLNQRAADSTYLLDLLNRSFPLSDWSLHSSWVGIRAAPVDRNPLVGPAPLWQLLEQNPFKWFHNQPIPTQKGLFYSAGFGSKGASHAPLAGEHLVNLMTGEPSPLSSSQQKFLSPGRFWLQQARQKTARKRHQPS
jgi:tRNA 5-methylaminomethyl-2-thiouridine biosynthesis bifunctional protein